MVERQSFNPVRISQTSFTFFGGIRYEVTAELLVNAEKKMTKTRSIFQTPENEESIATLVPVLKFEVPSLSVDNFGADGEQILCSQLTKTFQLPQNSFQCTISSKVALTGQVYAHEVSYLGSSSGKQIIEKIRSWRTETAVLPEKLRKLLNNAERTQVFFEAVNPGHSNMVKAQTESAGWISRIFFWGIFFYLLYFLKTRTNYLDNLWIKARTYARQASGPVNYDSDIINADDSPIDFENGVKISEATLFLRTTLEKLDFPAFGIAKYEKILSSNYITRREQLTEMDSRDWQQLQLPEPVKKALQEALHPQTTAKRGRSLKGLGSRRSKRMPEGSTKSYGKIDFDTMPNDAENESDDDFDDFEFSLDDDTHDDTA